MTSELKPGTGQDAPSKDENPLIKLALEMGPLVLFFVTNAKAGIFTATAVFIPMSWSRSCPTSTVVSPGTCSRGMSFIPPHFSQIHGLIFCLNCFNTSAAIVSSSALVFLYLAPF